jgi:uncharacterized membrane protein
MQALGLTCKVSMLLAFQKCMHCLQNDLMINIETIVNFLCSYFMMKCFECTLTHARNWS